MDKIPCNVSTIARIFCRRIQKSYDTNKYTKVCGGGSYKSNASGEGKRIISNYGNCESEYGKIEFGGEYFEEQIAT
jgi:hypothetical protein